MEIFMFVVIGLLLYAANEYQKGQIEDRKHKRISALIQERGEMIKEIIEAKYGKIEQAKQNVCKLELYFPVPFRPIIQVWHSPSQISQFSTIRRRGHIIWERLPKSDYVELRVELLQLMLEQYVIVGTHSEKYDFTYLRTNLYNEVKRQVLSAVGGLKYEANDALDIQGEEKSGEEE